MSDYIKGNIAVNGKPYMYVHVGIKEQPLSMCNCESCSLWEEREMNEKGLSSNWIKV